ncbi:MAG: indolepyruvate ferredoxin oxidoreductase subunit alpha [bacterium]|nr:indolepyruvate ferredoxin oxidoreductase subunit alpha [bacterium]MDD4152786.1 indolepyruvate ferredoxin oxidoreductase subunit alpha [bacterium]MDD4558704.1 indolepyruvate ferredoxin oxidoreductase subunit alpha [bacterium]
MKKLLSGNEAIARGAWEGGVRVASAYPGTPSTEIMENIATYPEIYSEWAPNEKVAMEVALGGSFGGARALVSMKHVGLNVAADPLFTAAYTGVNGGLVIITADDPGMHSSQNEQDNRHYARAAKVPMLDPSDSAEAREFTMAALDISENFDTPVLLHTTTRISHGKSTVEMAEPLPLRQAGFQPNKSKYVMIPAYGKRRHLAVEKRLNSLAEFAGDTALNRIEWADTSIGVITSGIAYQYVKEVAPHASVLKLGLIWPLPADMIKEFAAGVDRLYVVEELDPFLEEQIKALGVSVIGKEAFPVTGELNPELIGIGLGLGGTETGSVKVDMVNTIDLPMRAPAMCSGCPHRGLFYTLKKLKLVVAGDIGCYTLAVGKPLEAIDTCVCMGASIGGAMGMEKAGIDGVIGVLGDSTFIHSGITGLINMVYNGSHGTVVVLDNRITAMTGRQQNAASGKRISGDEAPALDIPQLCRALGVNDIHVVDPYDLQAMEKAVRAAVDYPGVSVVITKRPCLLIDKKARRQPVRLDNEACRGCGLCLKLGCPAIEKVLGEGCKIGIRINETLCTGCGICTQICPSRAIAAEWEEKRL